MSETTAPRDENATPTLIAQDSTDPDEIVVLEVDATSGGLKVEITE